MYQPERIHDLERRAADELRESSTVNADIDWIGAYRYWLTEARIARWCGLPNDRLLRAAMLCRIGYLHGPVAYDCMSRHTAD